MHAVRNELKASKPKRSKEERTRLELAGEDSEPQIIIGFLGTDKTAGPKLHLGSCRENGHEANGSHEIMISGILCLSVKTNDIDNVMLMQN